MHPRRCGLLLLGALPLWVHADETFRCGRWIVTRELTPTELLGKCGEPTSRQVRTEDVYARNARGTGTHRTGTRQVETWRYVRGTQSAAMIVVVAEGKIESLERER